MVDGDRSNFNQILSQTSSYNIVHKSCIIWWIWVIIIVLLDDPKIFQWLKKTGCSKNLLIKHEKLTHTERADCVFLTIWQRKDDDLVYEIPWWSKVYLLCHLSFRSSEKSYKNLTGMRVQFDCTTPSKEGNMPGMELGSMESRAN